MIRQSDEWSSVNTICQWQFFLVIRVMGLTVWWGEWWEMAATAWSCGMNRFVFNLKSSNISVQLSKRGLNDTQCATCEERQRNHSVHSWISSHPSMNLIQQLPPSHPFFVVVVCLFFMILWTNSSLNQLNQSILSSLGSLCKLLMARSVICKQKWTETVPLNTNPVTITDTGNKRIVLTSPLFKPL